MNTTKEGNLIFSKIEDTRLLRSLNNYYVGSHAVKIHKFMFGIVVRVFSRKDLNVACLIMWSGSRLTRFDSIDAFNISQFDKKS